jgi:outer membrane protein assembly factor BamB
MSTGPNRPRRRWLLPLLLIICVGALLWNVWRYWAWQYFDPDLAGEPERTIVSSTDPPSTNLGGWPQWRGPNRDGISADKGFRTDWSEDSRSQLLLWEKPIGKGYSSLAIADGRLFTMYGDGSKETVLCLDAGTGAELWRHSYRCVHSIEFGPGPRSTPTVDGDRVYSVGITGLMHCRKVDNGDEVWKRDLLRDFGAQNLRWGVSFSPLIVGDLVYVNPGKSDGHSLAALNKYTGEVHWHHSDDVAGYSSPVVADLAGKKQVVFFTGTGLVGVAPDSGEVYWRYPFATQFEVNSATPIIVGDHVFASASYGAGCKLLKIEAAHNTLTAKLVYENKKMENHFSSSIHWQDHIYGFDNAIFKCLNFGDGKQRWAQRDFGRGDFGKGSFLIADGQLIILSEEGFLVLADADPRAFKVKAGFQALTGRCWTVPVLVEGRLFLRNEATIMCLDLRKKS